MHVYIDHTMNLCRSANCLPPVAWSCNFIILCVTLGKHVADMDTHTPCSSSLTSLSDDFSNQVKTNMENTDIPTNYYVKIAEDHLEEMAQRHYAKAYIV